MNADQVYITHGLWSAYTRMAAARVLPADRCDGELGDAEAMGQAATLLDSVLDRLVDHENNAAVIAYELLCEQSAGAREMYEAVVTHVCAGAWSEVAAERIVRAAAAHSPDIALIDAPPGQGETLRTVGPYVIELDCVAGTAEYAPRMIVRARLREELRGEMPLESAFDALAKTLGERACASPMQVANAVEECDSEIKCELVAEGLPLADWRVHARVSLEAERRSEEDSDAGECGEREALCTDERMTLRELTDLVRARGLSDGSVAGDRLVWVSTAPDEDRAHFERGIDTLYRAEVELWCGHSQLTGAHLVRWAAEAAKDAGVRQRLPASDAPRMALG